MESSLKILSKKSKSRINFNVIECVRQFELPQQFPSTTYEFNPSKLELKNNSLLVKKKNLQDRTSTVSLTKMKFVPNKELQLFDNPQKLKLQLLNGKDVGELKIVLPNNDKKSKPKIFTVSKIGAKPKKSFTQAIQLCTLEKNKPKVKTINNIFNHSISNHSITIREPHLSKLDIHLINDVSDKKNNRKYNYQEISKDKNLKKRKKKLCLKHLKILCDQPNNPPQAININTKQTTKPEEPSLIGNIERKTTKSESTVTDKKIISKNSLYNSLLRKRDSSFISNKSNLKNKKPNLNPNYINLVSFDHSDVESLYIDKNILVVPKECTNILPEKISNIDNSPTKKCYHDEKTTNFRKSLLTCSKKIKNLHEKELVTEDNYLSAVNDLKITDETVVDDKQNLYNRLKIVKETVFTVQNNNLRVKALEALNDCGIKIQKRIPQICSLNTKIINESQTQTEIFGLLKKAEFTQVIPEFNNLPRIKQRCLAMKQPINSLHNEERFEQTHLEDEKFKKELDECLEKIFCCNTEIIGIKEVFIKDKTTQILNQLQIDFEQCIKYNKDGLMGIHRAIINNNIQEVQKYIILLQAMGKNIDICSLDEKTSLELAVQYESDLQIIKLLLASGAQPVLSKPIHDSAIIIAAKNSSETFPLLLDYVNEKKKLLLNSKDSEGFAAIHYCAMKGNLNGIIKLLECGVDVNLQDERCGKTALFYALDTKNSEVDQDTFFNIAFKLLEYGATPNIPTFSKHTVLSILDDINNHSLKIALNKAVK